MPDDGAILRAIDLLRAEVRALAATIEYATRPPRLCGRDRQLLREMLPVIVEFAGNSIWTCAELYARAAESDAERLRVALVTLGVRAAGKLFARSTGVPVAGLVVERLGDARGGALWRVSAVEKRA